MHCNYGYGYCTAPDIDCPHWQDTFCELDYNRVGRIPENEIKRNCHKCVYEVGCHGNPVGCKSYKRKGGCYEMSFDNRAVIVIISNYATDALNSELSYWGERGYKLVSTEMVKNIYGITNMYLFFTKETQIDG